MSESVLPLSPSCFNHSFPSTLPLLIFNSVHISWQVNHDQDTILSFFPLPSSPPLFLSPKSMYHLQMKIHERKRKWMEKKCLSQDSERKETCKREMRERARIERKREEEKSSFTLRLPLHQNFLSFLPPSM